MGKSLINKYHKTFYRVGKRQFLSIIKEPIASVGPARDYDRKEKLYSASTSRCPIQSLRKVSSGFSMAQREVLAVHMVFESGRQPPSFEIYFMILFI